MVINWTQFFFVFQMVFYHPIFGPVFRWSTKLDHFIKKKKCFYDSSNVKWSRLVLFEKQTKMSGFFSWSGIRLPVSAKMDHAMFRQVWFLNSDFVVAQFITLL
jgi:hypothetical protein